MTKQVQRRRGTSTQHTSFTGAEGEISVNTTNKSIHVHDGTTAGGVEAARADLANVSDTSLNNALSGNTLASLTITSADINGGTIDGTTIGGTSAAAVTTTSLVATTADINGGTVDGAIIGGSSAAAITGTTITATGDVTIADKIVHAGDTNTAIRFPAADTVTVETDGTERLRVDSSGNVGIGTASPAQKLVTDGNILASTGDGGGFLLEGNSGILRQGITAMGFNTNGSERMRIDSSGNLGIGTSSPAQKLDVTGGYALLDGLRIGGGDTANTIYQAAGALSLSTGSASGIAFKTNLTDRMAIDASGNVGIGTSSPGVVLDVVGRIRTTDAAMILRSTGDVSTTGVGYLSFNGSDNVERGYVGFGAGNGSVTLANLTANPLTFVTNNAERMRIDSSGNVGIGGVPNAWHVNFDAIQLGSNYAAFVGDGSNAYAEVLNNAYASGATTYNYVASLAATRYSQQLGTHVWYAAGAGSSGNAISWLERMRISSDGRVQIASTNNTGANVKLVVGSGLASSNAITVINTGDIDAAALELSNWDSATTSFGPRIYFGNSGHGDFLIGAANGSNNFDICRTWGTPDLRITGGGNLVSTPTYNNTSGGAANVGIAADGAFYRSTSSLKYKRDVQDATHGLTELMALRPVTYKGKAQSDGDTVYGGLIAEEVHDAGLTEFVQYAEDGSPDALAYANMVSLCIKAIQELKAEVDSLRAQLNP